jgi:ABC-type branched-subunit amino acid transport system substrate-binding protein
MKRFRGVALAVVLVLVTASCSRSGSPSAEATASNSPASSSASGGGATALANGGFGDLSKVCSPGDTSGPPKTASDKGVTATDIHIGTVTDKGFPGRSGLNKEMYDGAVAFAAWCNSHGGISGRKLVIDDRDAALTNYQGVVTTSCDADLALVGGGAVFDDGDNGAREACGLPNLPGYVVTQKARTATLQVQAVPNPVDSIAGGPLVAMDRISPGSLQSTSVMTGNLGTTIAVRDDTVKAINLLGGKVVDQSVYNPNGESDWSPFVTTLKDKNVKALIMVGEPVNLALFEKAMATADYYPDVIMETANFYDTQLTQTGGDAIKNTYVGTSFVPFENASQNKATQDYLDMMKQFNPGGKVAALGAQGMSALLLFAQAATQCGANLTRQCLLDNAKRVTTWTGGGLHGQTNPGANGGSPCFLVLQAAASGFSVNQQATAANQGMFNCDPKNVLSLNGGSSGGTTSSSSSSAGSS